MGVAAMACSLSLRRSVVLVSLCLSASCLWAVGCSSRSVPLTPVTRTVERTYDVSVVATDHSQASRAGQRALSAGGNAVDAAVAASLAISVVRPESAGIGGGGFMVIYLPAHDGLGEVVTAIDYRERAPAGLSAETFVEDAAADSRFGGHAVAVPGTVAGLLYAHERYGRLPLSEVIRPAIELATGGYVADVHTVAAAEGLRDETDAESSAPLADWVSERRAERDLPNADVWTTFLRGGDVAEGTVLRNAQQALVLELIAERGRAGFYQGEVARAMVRAVSEAGGVLTLDDLAGYEAREVAPLEGVILNRRVLTMPPPSSGGVALLETAMILEAYHRQMTGHVGEGPLDAESPSEPGYVHALVESSKHAFADRARFLADPEFAAVPVEMLTSSVYAFDRAEALHPERTLAVESYGATPEQAAEAIMLLEDAGTSHISVVDRFGGAVSVTETINLSFGSRIVTPGYGFALNNQVDDFSTRPGEPNAFGLVQSPANAPGAGKRPLSSMSPTIVLDGAGDVVAVAGASGGPRIISSTLQTLLNVLLFDMPASDAVAQPRVHHQWLPEVLFLEPGYDGDEDLKRALRLRGHGRMERREAVGAVQLIRRSDLRSGGSGWQAAADGRKAGASPAGE